MKTIIYKNTKRILSTTLALVMLVCTLFVTNVAVNITADAATAFDQWDGNLDTQLAGDGTEESPYLITSAEELAAVCYGSATGATSGAYFKVSGVNEFYMDSVTAPATVKAFLSAAAVKTHYDALSSKPVVWNPNGATVKLNFDGNGATVYGLYMTDISYAGLFARLNVDTVIKNIAVKNSYINNTTAMGGATGYCGFIFGAGQWGASDNITIKNCIVMNNYVYSYDGNSGEIFGHGADTAITVDSCLVADNDLDYKYDGGLPYQYFGRITNGTNDSVINSIGIDVTPQIRGCAGNYSNNYYYGSVDNSDTDITRGVTEFTSLDNMQGTAAKENMSSLNWATNAANGEGYWHLTYTGYPLPIKPDGWQEIILAPVWDGTAADSFTGGSGTKDDPYIIETAEQLYKMVKDGGRIWNDGDVVSYTPAYYKVGNGITDIYLNNVQGGNLDTLKGLVTAKTAKNWSAGFNADNNTLNDLDEDGLADESAAFIGVFDGNGVTIHGLYSTNEDSTYVRSGWTSCTGIGFVPALTGNAVIKNVNFDKSYIYSNYFQAAVLTTSFGLDNNGTDKYAGDSTKIKLKSKFNGTANVSIYNVSVRNAYVETASSADWTGGTAGIIASHSCPSRATMINCLFDGYSSEIKTGGSCSYYNAGLFSGSKDLYGYRVINCVSLGLYPMPNNANIKLINIHNIGFTNSYTDIQPVSNIEFVLEAPITVTPTDIYTADMMPLLNWGIWELKTVENNRVIPKPGVTNSNITGYGSIKDMVLEQVGGAGLYSYLGAQPKGTYGQYDKLMGSGTEADPYLITNAQQLANAIATGGLNVNQQLYYKLTTNINLGSLTWIDTETEHRTTYKKDDDGNPVLDENGEEIISEDFDEYKYVPFQGELDGDGYTIYELNATANNNGALIPQLNGGTVKNLHVRNSAAKTAIFGVGTGKVENCSAVNCYVADTTGALVSGGATAVNSHFDDTYYLADGVQGEPVLDGEIWYGVEGNDAYLVSRAKSMPCADIDGDGKGYEYGAADLAALRNSLLNKEGYDYIYGDVSGNGKTNISDLVILTRATTNNYTDIQDGFWRNLELGKFTIYYGENDNYDAARKLELYLEAAVPGVDIKKAVSGTKVVSGQTSDKTAIYRHANDIEETPSAKLAIVVGDAGSYTTEITDNNYAITYDKQDGVLWLQGDNFTAVEQAVLDFINKSDVKTSTIYTVANDTLSNKKIPVTLPNGSTYYYTWGDEFDGISNIDESGYGTGLNEDNWDYNPMGTETGIEEKTTQHPKYYDLEFAFNKDLSKLYDVKNGKLTIRRGTYDKNSDSDLGYAQLETPTFDSEGYAYNELKNIVDSSDIFVSAGSIETEKSLLVKQGYFEFKASLPSDGHSFASWWMMGTPSGGNNNAYTDSLYGKIYKLNSHYVGGNTLASNAPSTYKYQLPNSYFEIDIIELMQDINNLPDKNVYGSKSTSTSNRILNRSSWTTGLYDYELPFNIHKYFDTGLVDGKYYYIDWENYNGDSNYTAGTGYLANGSADYQDGIFSKELGSHNFGNQEVTGYTISGLSWSSNVYNAMTYDATAHNSLTKERKYGFEWKVATDDAGVGQSFSYTIYIYDKDGDYDPVNGTGEEDDIATYTITDITYSESANLSTLDNLLADAKVANQYMSFLIDNTYYTNNQYHSNHQNGNYKLFDDLLTKEYEDKTTLDIDYMRVYQADGRRDIVTPETEAFNNGNHFGY